MSTPDPSTDSLKKLRKLLNCTCAWDDRLDGRVYNLKTEEYEDCECVEKIPQLSAWKDAAVLAELEDINGASMTGPNCCSTHHELIARINALEEGKP